MTPEEHEALARMPVYLDRNGALPPGSPSAEVINRLHGRGLIVLLADGDAARDSARWALTTLGQREVQRFPRKPA